MWRTFLFAGAAAMMSLSLVATGGEEEKNANLAATDDSYVKIAVDVEIRGTLRRKDDELQVSARQRVYQVDRENVELPYSAPRAWRLEFARDELKNAAARLVGQKVVLQGKCELRMLLHPPRPMGSSGFGPRHPPTTLFDDFLKKRAAGRPFCFWFGSVDPHRPYEPGSGRQSGLDRDKIKLPAALPDAPEVREDVADYYFEVERFDREVGELLARLEALGELDRTIVVMTGDHGMPFPRGKGNLYDLGTHVPLAVRWGDKIARPGRRDERFVSLTDLAPTFLLAGGVGIPAVVTGRDLAPLLTRPDAESEDGWPDHALMGRERHTQAQEAPDGGGYPSRAIRTKKFLYIRNFAPDRWPAGTPNYQKAFLDLAWLGDCDNGPSKAYLWQHRDDPRIKPFYDGAFAKRPAEELYDLATDPDQLTNIASDARYAEAKRELSEQLLNELKRGGDLRALDEAAPFDEFPYYGGVPQWPWKQ